MRLIRHMLLAYILYVTWKIMVENRVVDDTFINQTDPVLEFTDQGCVSQKHPKLKLIVNTGVIVNPYGCIVKTEL